MRCNLSFFSTLLITLLAGSTSYDENSPQCLKVLHRAPAQALSLDQPDPYGEPTRRRLKRLTDSFKAKKGNDFGDPSMPDFSNPNEVRVYTTNGEALVWQSSPTEAATNRFLRGVSPKRESLKTVDYDGKNFIEVWDPTIQSLPEFGSEKFLYGGASTPLSGYDFARWPEDDWRRRISAFRWDDNQEQWVRIIDSMMTDPSDKPTWIGHSYGHHIQRDEHGKLWMLYERVTEERDQSPWKTEIFMRPMISPTHLGNPEVHLLNTGDPIWPAAQRSFGGSLVEGARVFQWQDFYLMGFSAGDYQNSRYGIHLAWSKSLHGPFTPYLNKQGDDLFHFESTLEKLYPMIWGGARPAFFEVNGNWWVLFHGILKHEATDSEDGQRDVFLAPVRITPRDGLPPRIEILAEE